MSPPPSDGRATLDAFFQGLGYERAEDLERLARWALEGAQGRAQEPAALLALARARTEAWLVQTLGAAAGSGPLLARGRLALLQCAAARRFPAALGSAEVPEALRRALVEAWHDALPAPLPTPAPCAMPEQQLVLWPWLEALRRWWRTSQADVPVP